MQECTPAVVAEQWLVGVKDWYSDEGVQVIT